MSAAPENELDLEHLFLPAWAQQPSSVKQYAQYDGREEERGDRRGDRRPGRRRPPRDELGGRRRDEGGPRPAPRGPRPEGGQNRPPSRERRGPGRGGLREDREPRPGRERFERREPPQPLPQINVALLPDDKGVESLARQIRMTGRAYPLFGIAQLILQKPERHAVTFSVEKNAEGQPVQPLFVCALDETLWLSEDEAIAHVLKNHFTTFYQAERTAIEPPKGKYTFVAQCGMSGKILGPPNHHDYQNQLRKLHSERFSRMPFEVYKSRVRIVRDEEVVKKWTEEQSFTTEYICLNMPEPLRLAGMEAVEKHFREVHKENIVKPVESHNLSGTASRALRSPQLQRLVRQVWEDQRRFPLQIATVLSQQFATHGLQFFKVNKTITHVSVARPHYLDLEATPVSDGVKQIVDFINAHSKCTRRQLVESLAPSPAGQPAQAGAAAEPAQTTPEQTAVIADLHWLIHQGHVIEFANGTLETAKKPVPKPPKPEPKSPAQPAEPVSATPPMTEPSAGVAAAESAPVLETASATDVESTAVGPMTPPEPSSEPVVSTAPEASHQESVQPASDHDSPAPEIPPAPASVTHPD
jgi:hypothetical protein